MAEGEGPRESDEGRRPADDSWWSVLVGPAAMAQPPPPAETDPPLPLTMIQEYLRLAFQSLWHRPLRSGLTILGIVIGIAAIVSLISVSQGLENAITAQFQQLGSNRMFVVPKGLAFTAGSVRTVLTTADAELLERMSDFKWVNQYLLDTLIVEFHKEKKSFSVTGLDTKDFGERAADLNLRLAQGRFFSDHETLAVLLGGRVPTEAFDKDVRLNTNLEIGGKKFKVVGIL